MQYCRVTHTGFGLAGFAQAGKSHSAIGGLVLSAQTASRDAYKNVLFESTKSGLPSRACCYRVVLL